ncbi:urease accessory protein UreD [Dechloromonas sp. ZS-1]|uniref:urease accessory protein UreD n=1 Tax=Dechloromonas sp. ZS-1 TaxID=3138067 RepID=UPI0031FCE3A3
MTSRPASLATALPHWQADLQLVFAHAGARTVLQHNRHRGPLRVQKALYPEGEAVCQAIVLHPPSGIAGGDHLQITVEVGSGAHAQLTTPGAGKWYRSGGVPASQQIDLSLAPGASLEWLPQESIVFDGAEARMQTQVRLAADSRYLAWDILCLGRAASGERFERGEIGLFYRVDRQTADAGQRNPARPIWLERGSIAGADSMLGSPAGWAGHTVCGTLLCSFPTLPQEAPALLAALRAITPADDALHGITCLPDLLLARYLGDNSEAARLWFTALWHILRPACFGRPAVIPRIWQT